MVRDENIMVNILKTILLSCVHFFRLYINMNAWIWTWMKRNYLWSVTLTTGIRQNKYIVLIIKYLTTNNLFDITSTQKCSYTVCGNCIHTVNMTIDSRLRKPLSNCLSSKVTFNVCSKLLWVKYKFFFAQKRYEKKFDYNFLQLST